MDAKADNLAVDGSGFRAERGVQPNEILLAMVCRRCRISSSKVYCRHARPFVNWRSRAHRVRLVVVGDGRARGEVTRRAAKVNVAAGREVVLMTGEMEDPSPAYASADVVIGQGGSALRGMTFGKPLW